MKMFLLTSSLPLLVLSLNNAFHDEFHLNDKDVEVLLKGFKPDFDVKKISEHFFKSDENKECYDLTKVCSQSTKMCPNSSVFVAQNFEQICPHIIKNALIEDCHSQKKDKKEMMIKSYPLKTWLVAIGTSIIVNICAINGFLFMSIFKKKFFDNLLFFLLSLAIGVLMSNAVLHLLPNSLNIEAGKDSENFSKFLFVLVGIYSFFVVEICLKVFLSPSGHRESSNNIVSLCAHQHIQQENDNMLISDIKHESDNKDFPNSRRFFEPVFLSDQVSSSALLILISDLLHNLVDGLVIGSSYAESINRGLLVSVAIFFEEFTHELGDFAVLMNSGMSKYQAVFWNGMATITNIIGCIIGLNIGINKTVVSIIEAFCCGMFLYLSLVAMLPDVISKIFKLSGERKFAFLKNVMIALTGIMFGYLIMIGLVYCQAYFKIE